MKALLPQKITGVIQHYAWGGHERLAQLTGLAKNNQDEPWAELWFGTHLKGPAQLGNGDLADYIAADPTKVLGPEVAASYAEELPYLLKVLDVREMLSIQIHPTKAVAEAGFAKEETAGIDRLATNRNYRDRNHKPELGVALTDFYLLHGFRSETEIAQSLKTVPGWYKLAHYLEVGGVKALYRHVMESDQTTINGYLKPLQRLLAQKEVTNKFQPGFWAKHAFKKYTKDGHFDRGIFSVYWFNIVHLQPGEGIFQDAGIPHAYLEGSCIELMANSDNVLRGGLTAKHIDVPELLANIHFEAVVPEKLRLQSSKENKWKQYLTPAPDFSLSCLNLSTGEAITESPGPAIYLVLEGEVTINDEKQSRVAQGSAVFLPYNTELQLTAEEDTLIYRAT